jgi:sulfide:quinone oxidoreductase
MTQSPHITPLHVVIVGGGIAALESVLALHALAQTRVHMTLIAPESDFVMRPMAVAVPFARGHTNALALTQVMDEHGGAFLRGTVEHVDADARSVTLATGEQVLYDVLVLAPGARPTPAYLHALTFGAHPTALNGIVADLEEGWSRSIAFVVPPGCSWPLPLYELALMTAESVWSMNIDDAEVHFVTPELAPLEIFGADASAAVGRLLDDARIRLHAGVSAQIPHSGVIETGAGPDIAVDCVVALPTLEGRRIDGVPSDERGYIAVDDAGIVAGLDCVYAVGDATDRPIKQGGLACQQADVMAAHVASRAGAAVVVPALEQILHGRLLTGKGDRLLRGELGDVQGSAADESLAWIPAKVSGRYLSPYLVANHVVRLPTRGDVHQRGVDVRVHLTRQQQRVDPDVLGLSPLGVMGVSC